MKHVSSLSRVVTVVVTLFSFAVFGQNSNSPTLTAKDAFATLKNLAGEWSGTINEKDKGPAGSVNYKVTANGSVVVETLFPGTEHEMITMYHLNGDQLMLTHYCAAANQPQMTLSKQSTKKRARFRFFRRHECQGRQGHAHAQRPPQGRWQRLY